MRLSVNIDHIATLRQARRGFEPDVIQGALEVLEAGADGITFHLREDRRHIQDNDVFLIKEKIQAPLNFEASLAPEIIEIVEKIKPHETTLVPERRQEITTEGGLDVIENKERLLKIIPRLQDKGIVVSLFVDADRRQIEAARKIGADAIEINTGSYSHLKEKEAMQQEAKKIREMVLFARDLGLIVNAGHGLNYQNTHLIAAISEIHELNIGHSIISRSIFVGLKNAVREMLAIIKGEKNGRK